MSSTDLAIVEKLTSLNENQKRLVLSFMGNFTAPPDGGTPGSELQRFSGKWGKELADEIEAIIERDCERMPEDEE